MILTVFTEYLHFDKYTGYLKEMFSLSSSTYSLRGSDMMSVTKLNTTSYALHSFSSLSAKSAGMYTLIITGPLPKSLTTSAN